MRSPWLTVQDVRVSGAQTLDTASLAELSGLQGQSMLRLDVDQARSRLLEVPQVGAVSVHRSWPNTVTLRITERIAVAIWTVGGVDYAVDASGVVLGPGAPAGPAPRIVEPDSGRVMSPGDRVHPDAIALAQRIFEESPRFLGESIDQLEYNPAIGVTAVFQSGLRVTFGDERAYDYKVAVLAKLLDQATAAGRPPHQVDLRFGTRVTYD
ncbi:MAG TPA: FtsQ-type POTRA domain-containing protein [Dehalococcoidia bacterium]|nr:FtsQ-type POTRA domain-containing protein [Dehalococcoidia bacterium]